MWVIIIFIGFICLFTFLMVKDAIVYRNYPISDEYWIAGLSIIGFLALFVSMILLKFQRAPATVAWGTPTPLAGVILLF